MRRFRAAPLVLMMALAACGQPGQAPATPTAPSQEAPPAPAPTAADPSTQAGSLAGAWRVAGIDGREFDEPVGLSLTGDERQLWWEPRCAGLARAYRIDGPGISFASIRPAGPAGSPPAPVCEIGLPPRLDEVIRALDNADRIARTPNNGILISGPDHSLVLFSQ
ncbi:hypothetical protein [Brevundimonas sp.]|uniref:hypothetical protein n=1 Tax=Brevundimonas sp. TaxID=1871086 RepID=UPI002FC74F60